MSGEHKVKKANWSYKQSKNNIIALHEVVEISNISITSVALTNKYQQLKELLNVGVAPHYDKG